MPGVMDTQRVGRAVGQAKVQCIVLHGRNQTPDDMQTAVIGRLRNSDVAYALPHADTKCWYNALAVSPLVAQTRDELARSLDDLAALIGSMRAEAPALPLVLAGFSQGACLAIEHAFTGKALVDAVVAFTGCRVGKAGDVRAADLPAGLPVYLSAGQDDAWIPLAAFAEAAVALGQGGAALRMDVFPGRAHAISDAEIAMLDGVLADLAAGQVPRFGGLR